MKHLYGRPRNSLWRIINTWAFAVHYHAVLCGRSIPFRSRFGRERPPEKSPGLAPYANEIFVDRLALSRSEDELSSIQQRLLRLGSFVSALSRTIRAVDAHMSSFPGGTIPVQRIFVFARACCSRDSIPDNEQHAPQKILRQI